MLQSRESLQNYNAMTHKLQNPFNCRVILPIPPMNAFKSFAAAATAALVLTATPVETLCAQPMTYKDISAQEAHTMMNSGMPVRIVDVRTPGEFETGHVKGAINVPLQQIQSGRIPFVMADKTATYLLYCRSGNRSGQAADILAKNGWSAVYNFGGIMDWPYEVVR